tara:strand:- start:127 stop:651 length:525 start_codon:yes stop_codon:yes gene_type:complete
MEPATEFEPSKNLFCASTDKKLDGGGVAPVVVGGKSNLKVIVQSILRYKKRLCRECASSQPNKTVVSGEKWGVWGVSLLFQQHRGVLVERAAVVVARGRPRRAECPLELQRGVDDVDGCGREGASEGDDGLVGAGHPHGESVSGGGAAEAPYGVSAKAPRGGGGLEDVVARERE